MSVQVARLVVLSISLFEEVVIWLCFAFGDRVGWRTLKGYAAWLASIPFVAGTPLAQLWLYRWMTGMAAGVRIRDNIVFVIVIIEELIGAGIVFYFAYRYDRQQKKNQ